MLVEVRSKRSGACGELNLMCYLSHAENGEKVVIGSSCGHVFHLACFMEWVEKKQLNCPICRSDMITPDEFTASSFHVLGDARVDKIQRINEEAARRLEEALRIKHLAELQQQQQQAGEEAALKASTDVQAASPEADVETGGVGANGETKLETATQTEVDKTVSVSNVATSSNDSA